MASVTRAPAAAPPLRVLVAVGLVAGSVLALQVLLTRVFAAVLFYHFGFLAISLALLGTGAGAMLIYIRPGWVERGPLRASLAGWSIALSASLFVVPALLVRLDYSFDNDVNAGFIAILVVASVLAMLPFLAAGIVIALAIKHYVGAIGRVYAFDLAGAGLGALAIVPLLWLLDAPTLIVALGVLAAVAALLFSELGRVRTASAALGASGVGLVALSLATSLYFLTPTQAPGDAEPTIDRWTPLSRVVWYDPSPTVPPFLSYDRDAAPVVRWARGTPHPGWEELLLGPQSIGYELTGPGHVLVIGGGGGRDIHNAFASGQRRIDVIELNRAIRTAVDEDLAEWSGSPYSLPGVSTTIGDGRSTLARRDTKYDQVHIGFTNTLSGNAGSSFVLSENNLYTLEAFDEYFDHLRPGGILNVSRLRRLAGDEALRATVLTLAALEERGVEDPFRHVVVVMGSGIGGEFGTVLARLEPYTAGELARIRRLAAERGEGVVMAPGGPNRLEWRGLAEAESIESFCEGYRLNVCPPTDDRPFFLSVTRLTDLGESLLGYVFSPNPYLILLIVLGVLTALSLLAFALPLAFVPATDRPPWSSLLFFAAIGVGFLTLEIALIQRFVLFLGFPTYALSVVLFSLLVFTGLGSLLTERLGRPRRTLAVALGASVALILAAALALPPLLQALIGLPFAARVAFAVAMLAPFGLTLGTAMPIGLRRLAALHPQGVPWAWGINGVTSVLASVLAVTVAISWGFTAATLLALACYAGALAHVLLGAWPDDVDEGGVSPSRRGSRSSTSAAPAPAAPGR
jgi:hypothetical protein